MKKTFSLFLFLLMIISKAQSLSEYQYILVPKEFEDFKANKAYGLKPLLEKSLKGKKYVILSDDRSQWPADALTNPCQMLSANLLDDKSLFRNKIILQFKDCKGTNVFEEKASSSIKEFEPGFQDALKQTLIRVPVSNPQIKTTTKTEIPVSHQEQTKSSASEPENKKTAQRYSNGQLLLQKIQIDAHQFILIDGESSVPFATFRATTKPDVFRVKLGSGESTIGYVENGNIVIETPNNNGDFTKEIFSAK